MRKLFYAASATLLFGALSLAQAVAAPPQQTNGTAITAPAASPPPDTRMNDHDADDANANSNGRYSADRDAGLDRAQDRASAEARQHGQALQQYNRDTDDRKADADDRRNDHDADDRRADNDHDADDRAPR